MPKVSNTGGVLGSYRMSDTAGQKIRENYFTDWGIPVSFSPLPVLRSSLETELNRA